MTLKEPKDVFLALLSDVRQSTERSTKFYDELKNLVQDPDISEIVETRSLIANQALERLDRCFQIIGAKPSAREGRLQETMVEDFKREIGQIQGPVARKLFLLAKLNHLTHFRIGEYVALTAASDITNHFAVGALLESCLADRLAFVERNRRAMRAIVASKITQKLAA